MSSLIDSTDQTAASSTPGRAMDDLFQEIAAAMTGDARVSRDEPMARRTTLRVGGNAEVFVEPAHEEDLARALYHCHERGAPVFILGRGSNLLVKDGGIRGVVISLARGSFADISAEGVRIRCGAGVRLKRLSAKARELGLSGLEFLEGIPGSVGGALRMNAGAMGSSALDVVSSIRYMDFTGGVHELDKERIAFGYRECASLKGNVALSAIFEGTKADAAEIAGTMKAFGQRRWSSQPAAQSAGCIFKNAGGLSAGRLIDELGLKGMRCGAAAVSEAHGNFIVNEGGATAADVLKLIQAIQEKARSERGIELATEVQIVGIDSGPDNHLEGKELA